MKPLRLFLASAFAVCALALCFLSASCETESASGNTLFVTPAESTLLLKQSITLKASGADNYTWSLATPEIGRLSTTVGSTTTYTALDGVGVDQIVTVVATTSDSSSSASSNTIIGSDTNGTTTVTTSSANRTVVIHHQ